MSTPQNSFWTLPWPRKNSPLGPQKDKNDPENSPIWLQKFKNDPKIKSNSKVWIDGIIENKSFSTK